MRSPPEAPAGGLSLPAAGRAEQYFGPPPPTNPSGPVPARPPSASKAKKDRGGLAWTLFPSGFAYFARSVASILVILAIALLALLLGLRQLERRRPKAVVLRRAKTYLADMAAGDYIDGYDFLSAAAKTTCPIDAFRLLQDTAPWTWSGAKVVKLEPEAAVVGYQLAQPGQSAREDFIDFVKEGDEWVRPFNRGVTRQSRQALTDGDADMADLKAQEAVRINPRDPVARAYLCEASYARGQADAVERECGLALQTAREYPSDLLGPELYRIYALLGQTLEAEGKLAQAAEAYTAMLEFPRLSNEDACRLSLARAQVYARLRQNAQASADLGRAGSVCASPADRAAAARLKAALERP